jgi:RecA-family ATPase
MIDSLQLFYQQLAFLAEQGLGYSAQAYHQAIESGGEGIIPYLDVILTQAQAMHHIDVSKDLADLAQMREAVKERAAAQKVLESIQAALNEETNEAPRDRIKRITDLASSLPPTKKRRGKTGKQIYNTVYPPEKVIIPDLVSSGFTILAGAPKIGKSWLVLSWAAAVSTGGYLFGSKEMKATEYPTLYITLEDTERRLNRRMHKLEEQGAYTPSDNLIIETHWTDGTEGLRDYLSYNDDIKFVIIDTLGLFADIRDFNDYEETKTKTGAIKAIADDYDIAILAVHHAKKGGNTTVDWMEAALGSQGLVGTSDATIILQRPDRDELEGEIRATGRDAVDYKADLKLDEGLWVFSNEQPEKRPAPKKKKKAPRVLTMEDADRILAIEKAEFS